MKFLVSLAVFCLVCCCTNIAATRIADRNDELLTAASDGNLDAVKKLIQQGANVNATNEYGWRPLHFSALNGHLDVVKYLIENGADIEAKQWTGETALHFASFGGKLEVVKYLVANGANIETKNGHGDGETAQDVASQTGRTEVVKFLKNASRPNLPSAEEKITTKYGDDSDNTTESSQIVATVDRK